MQVWVQTAALAVNDIFVPGVAYGACSVRRKSPGPALLSGPCSAHRSWTCSGRGPGPPGLILGAVPDLPGADGVEYFQAHTVPSYSADCGTDFILDLWHMEVLSRLQTRVLKQGRNLAA